MSKQKGEEKKFNRNFIVNINIFLYNQDVAGVINTIFFVTDFMKSR